MGINLLPARGRATAALPPPYLAGTVLAKQRDNSVAAISVEQTRYLNSASERSKIKTLFVAHLSTLLSTKDSSALDR